MPTLAHRTLDHLRSLVTHLLSAFPLLTIHLRPLIFIYIYSYTWTYDHAL
jgi:hypothetical protein